MNELISCARALVDGVEVRDFAFVIESGMIDATGTAAEMARLYPNHPVRHFGNDRLVSPGFINGHSHAYQILLRGWADDLTFEQWRRDALYRVIPRLTPDDIYWTFVAAFTEMLSAGITSVVEFFYINGAGNAHAQAAIRAATDVGIRLILARTWMDAAYAPVAFSETIAQAQERTDELIAANPEVAICVAPHSLHAASPDMIRASMTFAQERDLLVHIHVAEAAYEGEATLKAHGATPVALLERLGVLNERLVAVHAIYISTEEKALLASSGARVVHNPMTNQYLGDGTCDVVGLSALGVPIALGTDADVKPSLLDEMRAASLMQKVSLRDGSALGAATAFDFGTKQGARALGIRAGALAEGHHADFTVLDATSIDCWSPSLSALIYRGQDAWVCETYVSGKQVFNEERSGLAKQADGALVQLAQTLDLSL
ncbi:MAG: amidohydrolase family protein [Candidatus Eremiobacteraeota bacterium]|nr:amidohydrolase family protein [Candidatus Eremiobacteraeota bacterium]